MIESLRLPAIVGSALSDGSSAWADAMRLIASIELVDPGEDADMTAYNLGQMLMCRFAAPKHVQVRDTALRESSGIDHLLIILMDRGTVRGLAGHSAVAAETGDIVILDLAREHSLAFEGAQGLLVAIPRQLLAVARGDPLFHGAVFAAERVATVLASAQLRALLGLAESGALRDEGDAVAATRAALEALLEPLRHRQSAYAFDRRDRSLLGTMCRYIDQNIGDAALDVARLGSVFHVSRATVYRVFASSGGVAAYIRNARLDQAFEQMRRAPHNRERLNVLARRFGFASGDSFARAFKARFGLRPVQLHGHGDEGFIGAALHRRAIVDPAMTTFDRWLFEIGARAREASA